MSSSKPKDKISEGTIFMGPQESRESTVEKMFSASYDRAIWNKKTEEEYMERVKEKAIIKVKTILQKAEKTSQEIITKAEEKAKDIVADAEKIKEESSLILKDAQDVRNQADNLKDSARTEGYNEGIHQANDMFTKARNEIAQASAVILLAIHQQCITIFDSWRKDLSELLLEAVEVGTGFVIDNDKAMLLQNLLEKSTKALLDKREYHICVNPKDASLMTELLGSAHSYIPETSRWTLKTDPELKEGSIIVESPSGVIKSLRDQRQSLVQDVLNQLTLPLDTGDQMAFDSITDSMITQAKKVGLPLANEENLPEPEALQIEAENALPFSSPIPEQREDEAIKTENPLEPLPNPLLSETSSDTSNLESIHEEEEASTEEIIPFAHPEPDSDLEPDQNQDLHTFSQKDFSDLDISKTEANPKEIIKEEIDTIAENLVKTELKEEPLDEILQHTAENIVEAELKEEPKKEKEPKQLSPDLADELLAEMGF